MAISGSRVKKSTAVERLLGTVPYHTFLLALFIWLSAYAGNHRELFFENVYRSGLFCIGFAIVLYGMLFFLIRNQRAAGLVSSLVIIFVVFYGPVFDAIYQYRNGDFSSVYFMPLWLVVLLVLVVVVRLNRHRLSFVTLFANLTMLAMVLTALIPLYSAFRFEGAAAQLSRPETLSAKPSASEASNNPDIFFLVFDRYAGNRTLKEQFGFDNRSFLSALEASGFYVAKRSRANYPKTAHSLAATLNLMHLTHLTGLVGRGVDDWKPVYRFILDHEVGRYLKARGYRYVHLGSWWGPTSANAQADENIVVFPALPWLDVGLNEFEWLLIRRTLLARAAGLFLGGWDEYFRLQQHERILRNFEILRSTGGGEAPAFIFSHMLVPHPPYLFHADGRYKTRIEAGARSRRDNYIAQLTYTNQLISTLIESLLKRARPPVIIIQADEGPFPERLISEAEAFQWRSATPEELKMKYDIINAIYLPDRQYDALNEELTPVNTFRILFNRIFGESLDQLADKSYAFESEADLYTFFEVTDQIR